MIVIRQVQALRKWIEENPKSIGFVPTMGALHKGHLSLMEVSKQETEATIVSIFVNPLQFNNPIDLEKYPRTEEDDIALLEQNQVCDVLFLPSYEDLYAQKVDISKVDISALANKMEGASRPGHFEGVLKVVKRLFELTTPNKAYFGLKDYQQCMVIDKMVQDLSLDIELKFCAISRDDSGLARSSRNQRLTTEGRTKSALIYQSLKEVQNGFTQDFNQGWETLNQAIEKLSNAGFDIDYLNLVDAKKLEIISENDQIPKESRLFVAASLEGVRLIDNIAL